MKVNVCFDKCMFFSNFLMKILMWYEAHTVHIAYPIFEDKESHWIQKILSVSIKNKNLLITFVAITFWNMVFNVLFKVVHFLYFLFLLYMVWQVAERCDHQISNFNFEMTLDWAIYRSFWYIRFMNFILSWGVCISFLVSLVGSSFSFW